MLKMLLCAIAGSSLCLAQSAQACGPKRMHRRAQAVAYATPAVAHAQPSYAAPQAATAPPMYAYAPAAALAQPATPEVAGVMPTYNYQPNAEERPAYYYSYDSSGKLIVAQWADWLFRGGKEAGMPRPPLPVIGLLRGNN